MNTEQLKKLENTLWETADTLRANSDLKSSEYSIPVLGIIFLRFADNKYSMYENEILEEYKKLKGTRRDKPLSEIAIEKCGFYLHDKTRYDYLLNLPEKEDIARAIRDAMASIEEYKPELADVLPKDEYFRLVRKPEFREIPKRLLKNFADIPRDATGDMFGQIYEYFLSKFALAEGQGGGEFFTPRSVVRLMVEMIEPHDGTVFDPACGSGGMFVQSARFVEQHRARINGNSGLDMSDFYVSGMEKTLETVKLAKMNIFVNGLRGEIKQANTYYEDPFQSYEKFDYVLANPPFNVDDVALDRVENDARFNTYGVPRNKTKNKKKGEEKVPNANYLWINLFATSLKPTGRAGLVMANSASDARHSEADIRKSLIEHNLIYAMITLPSNMFYTVTLPATLWFFDKAREDEKILFIDARNIFTQIDRAHREFSEEQIQNIAIISRLHKNKSDEFIQLIHDYFEKGIHRLISYRKNLKEVSEKVTAFLKIHNGDDIPDFNEVIDDSKTLVTAHEKYQKSLDLTDVDKTNKEQQKLNESVAPFFEKLHEFLKLVDKKVRAIEKQESAKPKDTRTVNEKELKILKNNLDELHREVKEAEYFFSHITWLQERFPEARYEDVTGLCKLATHEEVKEQDYSLNPGRYVGVVIEEDGKTEEEFIADMADIHEELKSLNAEARKLETVIDANMRQIVGE